MEQPVETPNAQRKVLSFIFVVGSQLPGLAIGWIVFSGWPQVSTSPAPPGGIALPTSAPIVALPQAEVNLADIQPIPLADIPGNIAKGEPAPDFTVRTMGGGTFALSDHPGQPTLILFMASWCYTSRGHKLRFFKRLKTQGQ